MLRGCRPLVSETVVNGPLKERIPNDSPEAGPGGSHIKRETAMSQPSKQEETKTCGCRVYATHNGITFVEGAARVFFCWGFRHQLTPSRRRYGTPIRRADNPISLSWSWNHRFGFIDHSRRGDVACSRGQARPRGVSRRAALKDEGRATSVGIPLAICSLGGIAVRRVHSLTMVCTARLDLPGKASSSCCKER